ncbi:hypothetical protein N790_04900 [Arenimonas malthae CC-JY-1]|uniref:DUF3667 domain-containing protein n=1 Tax=Arenimonas malthae CC-JY-1 TaxID=1384054 RepID=A0A091BGC6_9GAMM|nr:DUF3667 domain-containing protein [Arenimonas malthae]KFN50801.1 hypothetical protein N790_04900 [Arenimonas malthae CC-JY-1]
MSPETAPPNGTATPERRCQNCGVPLLGEHCYACGQPTKGLVRHFTSIIGDFMDSVFELDSRILRTLGPLLFKPGYLSLEYFAGRRVRYVSPVRLFVFLSLFAFFAAQLSFKIEKGSAGEGEPAASQASKVGEIGRVTTVAEVEALRDQAVAELQRARKETADVPGVGIGLDVAEKGIVNEAERRIAEIERAQAAGEPVPVPERRSDEPSMSFNGEPWHPEKNPIKIGFLPDAANAKLNEQAGRAQGNIKRIQEDPNLLKDAFLSTVPTTLFVLLPLFALLLKVAYLFKKRLYMEHLIVALHSHSFLCGALLAVLLLDAAAGWTEALPWLSNPLGWLEIALITWMPLYLLLMQKRVYRQGWFMTLLKYGVLGTCYLVLVSFGAGISLLVSLVNV